MLTVSVDPVVVESQLVLGTLACPSCQAPVGPWGWARRRRVREGDRVRVVRPRRGRCRGCRVTHVLLPASLLLRRFDLVVVIGRVIEQAAVGVAGRALARLLGVPRSTVRGWLVRFADRAELLRVHFTRWVGGLPGWAGVIAPGGGLMGDAVQAIAVTAEAAGEPVWLFAAAATGGRLLCNTTSPFPTPPTP